eukprot:TRINITY_DN3985_c0_g1_i1.p2 TRINITY_DN3985_c0_g1~~TRINITY_DN3985_c0_g1_i1.p2  ORF type:complete len:70 (-),score=35.84 TRINITY_DN3985_c0_g1_i1:2-211(-)
MTSSKLPCKLKQFMNEEPKCHNPGVREGSEHNKDEYIVQQIESNKLNITKKKKYRLRGRSSETAKAHRG